MTYDELILNAPKNPGIYKMYDSEGELLYVGKAKNLLNRLRQYRDATKLEYHKVVMMRHVSSVSWQITDTETDALILEQNLIKTEKPKYNIIMKDDKMYPYLAISKDKFPRLFRFRDKGTQKKSVFGPFPFVSDLDDTIKLIQKTLKIRTCTDSFMASHAKRPCILYETGHCSAPCCKLQTDYAERVKLAKNILSGKIKSLESGLKKEMRTKSSKLDFEGAAKNRQEIEALQSTTKNTIIKPRRIKK